MKHLFRIILIIIILLGLTSCGPKGHRKGMHGGHGHGHGGKSEYKLLTKNDIQNFGEHSFDLNNGTEEQYESAANLSGTVENIGIKTTNLINSFSP